MIKLLIFDLKSAFWFKIMVRFNSMKNGLNLMRLYGSKNSRKTRRLYIVIADGFYFDFNNISCSETTEVLNYVNHYGSINILHTFI